MDSAARGDVRAIRHVGPPGTCAVRPRRLFGALRHHITESEFRPRRFSVLMALIRKSSIGKVRPVGAGASDARTAGSGAETALTADVAPAVAEDESPLRRGPHARLLPAAGTGLVAEANRTGWTALRGPATVDRVSARPGWPDRAYARPSWDPDPSAVSGFLELNAWRAAWLRTIRSCPLTSVNVVGRRC